MSMMTPRMTYSPFEFPWAFDYWTKQQSSHWLHNEVQMAQDVYDWKHTMTASDKAVVGSTLKGFTTTEIFVQDYWTRKVMKWFRKPEIQMMAATFGSTESIHAAAYANLGETLNINDFDSFLDVPEAKAKIDRLVETKGKTKREIALSLAIFSAFNEGVNLFSSFAILLSFSQRDLLRGLGQIIKWSIRDESLHSEAGVRLYSEFIKENPDLFDDEMKRDLLEAARMTVRLEDNFIDRVFELGPLPNINAHMLKNYIRFRCNAKLSDLGLRPNWTNLDKGAIEELQWFSVLSTGVENSDFFASRVTQYSKGMVDFDGVWDDPIILQPVTTIPAISYEPEIKETQIASAF